MTTNTDMSGKVAVLTGGAGVLCASMGELLAGRGAKVALLDKNAEAVATMAQQIGHGTLGLECDVLEKASLDQALKTIEEQLGPVDLLVNGAGGNHPGATTQATHFQAKAEKELGDFFDLDAAGIRFVLDLNFMGTLLPSQVFGQAMAKRGGGNIINISSMNALRPLTKIPAYSGAKAAVSNFTQWLAVHLAPGHIRVNALAPGFFLTNQNRSLLTQKDGSMTPRGKQIIDHTPMGRYGQPEDLHGPLIWLASEASAFVTGTVIPVDGGFSAYSGV